MLAGVAASMLAGAVEAAPRRRSRRKAPKPTVSRLEFTPRHLNLYGQGAREQLFVTAVVPDGQRKDVTPRAKYHVRGEAVTVDSQGMISAVGDGPAKIIASYGGREAVLTLSVFGTDAIRLVSFRDEISPILTKAGCNSGTCHGNRAGKGGLKLSLLGESPESDHRAFTREGGSRRINASEPGRSLLLLKPTTALPHGGGERFTPDSRQYRAISNWIAQGAQLDPPGAARLVSLEVTPKERIHVAPARMQRLTVLGRFSDGSVQNLTGRATFLASDLNVAVSEDGKVSVKREGDAAILVRYGDQMRTARLTFVPARKEFAWKQPPTNNFIDETNFALLKKLRLQPSALSNDYIFLRRAYLDAIGVQPTPEDVRSFAADQKPDKRTRLIDALLERPEFGDYWGLHWADLLRLEERSLDKTGVKAYQKYIRDSIADNKPMDQFARELLTETGSTYKNPATNYYRRTRTAVDLAETTAQVFMGVRLNCARCHNHPFEVWKQDDYYAMAALFARVDRKIEKLTRRDKFDKHELNGEEIISVATKGDVKHPRTGQVMAPRVPLAEKSLDATVADRRLPFAEWLTSPQNPFFARSIVNRTWAHLLGQGIIDPVDDIRESNPASNPALLDALAKDFVAHQFDLRHLVRTIMNSRTYQLSSDSNSTNRNDRRFFSRGVIRRLPAEVLLDAISQATGVPSKFKDHPLGTHAVQLTPARRRHPFLKLFGQPARETVCECERSDEPTLAQSLGMAGGETINQKLLQPDNRIDRLMAAGRSDAEIVTELYLATASREPNAEELANIISYIKSESDRRVAFEDILWALLNHREFLFRL